MVDGEYTNKMHSSVCKRCLHDFGAKSNMRRHFENRAQCTVNPDGGQDIPTTDLLREITKPTVVSEFPCKFCKKMFETESKLANHEERTKCRERPPVTPSPASPDEIRSIIREEMRNTTSRTTSSWTRIIATSITSRMTRCFWKRVFVISPWAGCDCSLRKYITTTRTPRTTT